MKNIFILTCNHATIWNLSCHIDRKMLISIMCHTCWLQFFFSRNTPISKHPRAFFWINWALWVDIFGYLRSKYHLIYVEAGTSLILHRSSNLWDTRRGRSFNNREAYLKMPHKYNLQATGEGSNTKLSWTPSYPERKKTQHTCGRKTTGRSTWRIKLLNLQKACINKKEHPHLLLFICGGIFDPNSCEYMAMEGRKQLLSWIYKKSAHNDWINNVE